jgi:hypothetical protein
MRPEARQLLLSLFAALLGVVPSILWNYSRFHSIVGYPQAQLDYLVIWNIAHGVVLFMFLLWWFGEKRPNLTSSNGVFLSIGATLLGMMLALLLTFPGIGLIVTGQALLNSLTAVFMYAALAPSFVGAGWSEPIAGWSEPIDR